MKRDDLTPQQEKVVNAIGTEKIVVVLGGPGTGKTTTALWAARALLEQPTTASWQKVLFLTFSRAAVGQIARRAPGVFSGKKDGIEISTFHGFAWRLVQAFGRYAGHGKTIPDLQSEVRVRLLGRDSTRLVYDDLIPATFNLLSSESIRALVIKRWPLVICDEFQDTSNEQWQLLRILSGGAQLLLLGDGNQLIYSFLRKKGVSPKRLKAAQAIADRVIELEARSHRDPSDIIPAMSEMIRQRNFSHEAVSHAIKKEKLRVFANVEEEALTQTIAIQVARLRTEGVSSIGVFAHSNEGIAALSASLAESGLDHVLVGIPEAHAEALSALASLCSWGAGLATDQEVRTELATFVTACTRGKVPVLALDLANGRPVPLLIEQGLQDLKEALQKAAEKTLGDLIKVATQGWKAFKITNGERPWCRACSDFVVLTRQYAFLPVSENLIKAVKELVERRIPSALVEYDLTGQSPIQFMNFHQTKGREADAVFLVYRSGDYLTDRSDAEPYEESSRVLFVSLTRARQQVIVILPPDPHPLVAPFAMWDFTLGKRNYQA